ncbi:aminoglycoside phosphotransferase family protein [Streptomyces sp. NPDC007856]|uniref:aminoglycoside phosphotransferase family protein n=1 Tax=Streptomyces sp. NPDC007856 TaxID=3364781 RepID=UPI00368BE83F
MISLPEAFVRNTVAREGRDGSLWAQQLPALMDRLLETWGCVPAGPMLHGMVAIALPVRRADGTDAVLKVSWPHPGNRSEPSALAAWRGRGAVLLLERDDDNFAMLLEALGQDSLHHVEDPVEAFTEAGLLARQMAVAPPPGLPRLEAVLAGWSAEIAAEARSLGQPLPRRVIDHAVATARELSTRQPETMVHGDLHFGNVLRARRQRWLAIDPKGFVGDPAYDGIALIRTRWAEAASESSIRRALTTRLQAFAEGAGLDLESVRRWAQTRAVVEAFWTRRHAEPTAVIDICDQIAVALT